MPYHITPQTLQDLDTLQNNIEVQVNNLKTERDIMEAAYDTVKDQLDPTKRAEFDQWRRKLDLLIDGDGGNGGPDVKVKKKILDWQTFIESLTGAVKNKTK